jgi:hypothetical protein
MLKSISGHLPIRCINSFAVLVFLLCSCSTKQIANDSIFGVWRLQSKDSSLNYPSVSFYKDSSAVLTSRADTIYRYQYRVGDNSIIFKDLDGKESEFKILELNSSTLVFENLFEHKEKQVYKR